MEPLHERNLKILLRKSQQEFESWVEHLTDKEINYVEWLLDSTEDALDEILLVRTGLDDASEALQKIMNI